MSGWLERNLTAVEKAVEYEVKRHRERLEPLGDEIADAVLRVEAAKSSRVAATKRESERVIELKADAQGANDRERDKALEILKKGDNAYKSCAEALDMARAEEIDAAVALERASREWKAHVINLETFNAILGFIGGGKEE